MPENLELLEIAKNFMLDDLEFSKDAIDEMEVGRKLFNSEEFEGDKDAITEMMSNQMCDM